METKDRKLNIIKSNRFLGLIARDHIGIFFPHPVVIEPYFEDGYTSYYQDSSNSGFIVNDRVYEDYEQREATSYPYQRIYSKNEEYIYS